LFRKGQIQDLEQRRRFLARLRPKIWKLCVVRTFAYIKELVGAATKVERVLGELGKHRMSLFERNRKKKCQRAMWRSRSLL
jgi:hypothetical protein